MTSPEIITIEATKGFSSLGLKDVWQYRDLLWFHVLREVKGKYRQMALGPLWIILNPVINMVLFTFVFGYVARLPSEGIPYPIFTYVGMIPWIYFASACQNSMGCLSAEMGVISKVYFPRLIMPLSAAISALIDFVMSFAVLVVVLACFGYYPSVRYVFLVPYLLLAGCTGLGIGLWTASVTVRFRDLRIVANNLVRIWMYLTPVAYSATVISDRFPTWMWGYRLNPMYWVCEGFRWCLLGTGNAPQFYILIPIAVVAVILVSGAYVFRRTERTIVDLL